MVWKSRIHPNKAIIYAVIISIAIAVLTLFQVSNFSLSPATGKEVIAGVFIALSAGLLSLGYIILRGLSEDNKTMIYRYLMIGFTLAIVLIIVFGILTGSMSVDHTAAWGDLFGYGFGLTILVIGILIISTTSIRDALGESGIEKIGLSLTRTKKIWEQYKHNKAGMFALTVFVVILIIAIIGPSIAPQNPLALPEVGNVTETPQPPSGDHWFGTDYKSKDVYSQFLYGARTSLIVGFLAGLISLVIGTLIGLSAGYYGRATDELLMRLTDFFLVIPWFPLMIVLVAILGRSLWIVIFVIGIVSWSPTARVVRAAVLSIKEKQYIERSRALGANNWHIIRRHVFPNVFPLIVATSILLVGEAIFSEAFLDFFGLGDPSVVSWGWMLERAHDGSAMVYGYWWWILPPGVGIILVVMCFYLIGDTLDEILNPRLKRR
jgi:peptide/nickel transport system permease protein